MAATKFKPLISDNTFRRVYENMLRARLLDEAFAGLTKAKHLATGKQTEAIDAAFLDGLKSKDIVIAASNRPTAALLRGEHLNTVVGDALSKDAVASRALIADHKGVVAFNGSAAEMATFAAGCARALLNEESGKRGVQAAVVAMLGEVASLSDIDTALRATSHANLPLILVVHTPPDVRLEISREKTHGVPNMPVDASDAVALMRCSQEAMVRVRTGLGGVLINARFLADTRDPLVALESHLRRKNIFKERDVTALHRSFASQLEKTLSSAR